MITENSYISIHKSDAITGTIMVEGAKNAILPIAPLSILSNGISELNNVPKTADILAMIKFMESYNIKINYDDKEKQLYIDTKKIDNVIPDLNLFSTYRASTIVSGAILSRFGEVWISTPGGDKIGKRPINIHLESFEKFGAIIENKNNYIHIYAKNELRPATIYLEYPSVGATQNCIIVASRIEGKTIIKNAAQEPEILDLVEALTFMGVSIELKFPNTIIINGSKNLRPFIHTAMSDRLEAGTLLIAAAITKGCITIPNAPAYSMDDIIIKLKEMGHDIEIGYNNYGLSISANEKQKGVKFKTMPYPGFSTDFQAPMIALASISEGEESIIHETVFESRMSHVNELNKMGSDIKVEYDCAKIKGVSKLYSSEVHSNDIRGCAALVIAALAAEGNTKIYGVNHLLRGYFKLNEKLNYLGANIEIVK